MAGHANVLVFPDLDCGQHRLQAGRSGSPAPRRTVRFSWACARQANDLSRGCSIEDVVQVSLIACALAAQARARTAPERGRRESLARRVAGEMRGEPGGQSKHADVRIPLRKGHQFEVFHGIRTSRRVAVRDAAAGRSACRRAAPDCCSRAAASTSPTIAAPRTRKVRAGTNRPRSATGDAAEFAGAEQPPISGEEARDRHDARQEAPARRMSRETACRPD